MKKGFSLIEVIVATFIFSFAILAIGQIFPYGLRITRVSQHNTVGTNLAQEILEETIANTYDEIIPGESAKERIGDSSSPFYIYFKQRSIQLVDQNLLPSQADLGLKKIIVTVSWQEGEKEKNVQLATLVARK